MSDHTQNYFREVQEVARGIDLREVDRMIDILAEARSKGRLFILGVGGGGRPRRSRRQRFSQALRNRGLCPHRQRLRADRAGQRRWLADQLRKLAAG
jgi:hypothetical protein